MKAAYEYAEKNGLKLRDEYTFRDLGVSAYDRTNVEKGALSLFLRAVREGRVKHGSILLVENLDRLTRTTAYKAVGLLGELVEAGVTVVTLSDEMKYTVESMEDDRNLFYSVMLFARGHHESKRKGDLIASAYKSRRLSGSKIICNIAPGWLKKDNIAICWVLDDAKAESVRKVYRLYLSGSSAHSICQIANSESWLKPSMRVKPGNGWHVSLVRRILSNPAVTGLYTESNGTEHRGFFPQVVTYGDFSLAQVSSETKAMFPRRRDNSRYNLFQGFLFCGYCGATMGYRDHGQKEAHHKSETRRYFCSAHVRKLTTTCKVRPGAQETQRNLLIGIYPLIADNISTDEEVMLQSKSLDSARAVLQQVSIRHARILEMIEYSTEPPKSLVGRLAVVENELNEAIRVLNLAQNKLTVAENSNLNFDSIYDSINEALVSLDESPEARDLLRQTLQRYVDKVYLYGRDGLANILLKGEKQPHVIIASDTGMPIEKGPDGAPRAVHLPLPLVLGKRVSTS
jgi:DNA invertase Pin-like site-specific DNA recombinase